MTTNPSTDYFVVPAAGHYGDGARVISHRTLKAASRAAGAGYMVRAGRKRKGDQWRRGDEQFYPVA